MRYVLLLGGAVLACALVFASGTSSRADDAATATYVGTSTCKGCHHKQGLVWKKTAHAKAFEVLGKDQGKEACLRCHVAGLEEVKDGAAVMEGHAKAKDGVGCEACHGPGSLHRAAKLANHELKGPTALVSPALHACTRCHNPDATGWATSKYKKTVPTEDGRTKEVFDCEKAFEAIKH